MKGYIYSIINKIDGKRYVGQTVDLERRKQTHYLKLRKNVHPNYLLQQAWNEWGEESFSFEYSEFEIEDIKELNDLEIKEIEKFHSFGNGYNLTPGGQGGIIRRKLTYDQFCFIYYGCQWKNLTMKIASYLDIDSSAVSSILREKSHLDYLEKSKKELGIEEIEKIRKNFRKALNIPENKQPDENRVPFHPSEEEYFYCFCIAFCYGRGIEAALGKFFNKHKSFLSNGLKAAKTQGKVKKAYERFLALEEAEVLEIGISKFEEWDLQSFSKNKIKQEISYKWRQ